MAGRRLIDPATVSSANDCGLTKRSMSNLDQPGASPTLPLSRHILGSHVIGMPLSTSDDTCPNGASMIGTVVPSPMSPDPSKRLREHDQSTLLQTQPRIPPAAPSTHLESSRLRPPTDPATSPDTPPS